MLLSSLYYLKYYLCHKFNDVVRDMLEGSVSFVEILLHNYLSMQMNLVIMTHYYYISLQMSFVINIKEFNNVSSIINNKQNDGDPSKAS
jgi:hypothetical protein